MENSLPIRFIPLPLKSQLIGKLKTISHSRLFEKSMLKLILFFAVFITLNSEVKSQCYTAPNYCTNITATNAANYQMGFQNIKFGTSASPLQINNTTPGGTGSPVYFNYSNLIVRALAGDTVNYSVQVGSSNSTTYRIFIDYNNDGVFNTTAPELVFASAQITGGATSSGFFILPSTLSAGSYRIRMASDGLTNIPPPCGPSFYSAEYEDYTLLVPALVPDLISGSFTQPTAPIVGNNTIAFNFTNISTTTITSVDVSYQVDANTPVTQSFSSISILPGATYTATFTTQAALATVGSYSLRAWTSDPNFSGNNTPGNDTICKTIVTYCSGPLSGTYTINAGGSGTTNFTSFGAIDSAMMSCGVSGAVDIYVTPAIYNEALIIGTIPGATATNKITFYGNGSTLQANCSAANPAVLRFQAVRHVTIDSLTLKSTNVNYGWGVHFFQNCDSNTVRNSIIDLTTVTSTTAANSAGIVFSNSIASQTTTGNTCVSNNLIRNYIKGNPTAGSLYYGIVGAPATSATIFTNNKFINNIIENFYLYGIYWSNGNRTVWRGNTLQRPTKTAITTTYGFYLSSSSRSDTIDGNRITNLYGASPTNANSTFLFYGINYSGTSTEPNIISNNLVYNIKGEGPLYGFYFLTAFNNRFLNNTLLFDNTSSTSANATVGLYWSGATSASSFLDFRNNIISFTRTGSGAKNALFTTGSWATGATINNNNYYSTSPNYNLASYLGVNNSTIAAWKATMVTTGIDQLSFDYSPNFVNVATQNYSPQDGAFDGQGANVISMVPNDFTGAPRTLPMDIGAFEASPIALDAAIANIVLPSSPYAAGNQMVSVRIRNAGTSTITSADINWSVNGVPQTPIVFSGSLTGGSVSAVIPLDSVLIAANTLYNISVTVSNPNSTVDPNVSNNTLVVQTASMVSGTLTINSTATGVGILNSFTALRNLLQIGGIGGPVIANVAAGSGPYTEQVFFGINAGASISNTVTINGNGEMLQFDNTNSGSIGILNLVGTDYMIVDNLKIRSLNASYGIGVILTSGADFNKITNCTIDIGSVTGSSLSAGISLTGSLSSPTTAALSGSNNQFIGNTITGNATGGPYYGITLLPNTTTTANTNNIVRNNIIRDITVYGFYMNYTAGTMVSGNVISRPTKSSPSTFYGFYIINGEAQDTFENNVVKQPFKALETSTGTFYGWYFATPNIPAARPVIFRNNQIYDIKSNGPISCVYSSFAANLTMLNNTFVVDHPTSTSTSTTYFYYNTGTPTTTTIRNNIFQLNRGGSGSKYIYYLATTGAGYVINNNVLNVKLSGTNNFHGYYAGNIATFANWKAVNASAYDQASVSADPNFRTYIGSEFYQPGNDSINDIGFSTINVPKDVTGATRSATPDPGAYEFSVPSADAGVSRLINPLSPISLGSQNVNVMIKNYGKVALTSADVAWKVNDISQLPVSWSGSLNSGDSANQLLGTYSFSTPGFYKIKAWTENPNFVNDSFPLNDTMNITVCTPLNGTYTVNPLLPVTDTNFASIQTFLATAQMCGVSGPIVLNVAPGIYNNALTFTAIPGLSATNNIVINGSDSATTKIRHDGSVQRATIIFNGAKNITLRNLNIEATAVSGSGFGIVFTNAADSNKVIRCTVKVATLTTGLSAFAPIMSSANVITPNTAGNNGSYILIDSCNLVGGYYGVNFFNNTAPKGINNIVRNCNVIQPYYYGVFMYYQNQSTIANNKVLNVGNSINTSSYAIYVYSSDNGVNVTKNQISGQIGIVGIYFVLNYATASNRNLIANNMVQLGVGTSTAYGIYDGGNSYTDIVHNTVNNTSGDASYVSTGIYFNYSTTTYNNARIVNNVFSSPNGAMVLYCPNTTVIASCSLLVNNNVFYSPITYPFRIVNTIYGNLAAYRTALGAFIPGCDSSSVWFQPSFFSTTNLRSISPQLDSIGMVFPSVPDDIDGTIRSTNAPDPGVYEFARPGDDAGVMAILQPVSPVNVGMNVVKLVIKNFGLNTLTSANVTYRADSIIKTRVYTGTLLPGAVDTVTFDATSGPGGTDQRFNYYGGPIFMKAYTSAPNLVTDAQALNDTSYVNFCSALSGVYTINPAGTGATNFVSFADAVNRLNCGGVSGNVTFNIASGTYTGQIDITSIAGASDTSRILFKSATGNAADVTLNSTNSTAIDNFTVRLRGAAYVNIEKVTIKNSNTTYSRVLSINKFTSTNTNTSFCAIRNCILEGYNSTNTADQFAVIFGPNGDNANNISIVGNQIKYGSFGISIGGQSIINLYSQNLTVDSNTIVQPYYMGMYLLNRNNSKIRYNYLDGNPSYGYYAMYLSGASGDMEVIGNNIQCPYGTYGIYLATCNYYGEIGLAKVINNVVNMYGTSSQYGIYYANGSQTNFINNTVRCTSTATTTYAYYLSGNTTVTTTPQVVQTNNIRLFNNILYATNGYAVYYANVYSVSGTSQSNNNLYYSGATNAAYVNGVNYTPATMQTTFRNALYAGSDRRSLHQNITFTSNTDLKPLASSATSWNASGRGEQSMFVPKDITGATRSTQVSTGAPDIGAYEFIPTATPPALTLTGSIGYGNTQYALYTTDTVGKIVWGFSGNLPTAISATYHTGALISDPTNAGNNAGAHYMDAFWRINATGGTSYNYDLNLIFDPNMLGTVPFMSDIKLAKKQIGASGTWTHFGSSMTTVDSVNYNFGVVGLNDFGDFTGTTDIAPLPVKLVRFDAMRSDENALLIWNTASEKNSKSFEIERAEDGKSFEKIGELKAAGNSNRNIAYNFEDLGVANLFTSKRAYYRLKMIDRDGSFEYSPVRVVDFNDLTPGDMNVYPNPFRDQLTLGFESVDGGLVSVEVTDLFGKVCYKTEQTIGTSNPEFKLQSLNKLADGVYIIKVTKGAEVFTRKLIKE